MTAEEYKEIAGKCKREWIAPFWCHENIMKDCFWTRTKESLNKKFMEYGWESGYDMPPKIKVLLFKCHLHCRMPEPPWCKEFLSHGEIDSLRKLIRKLNKMWDKNGELKNDHIQISSDASKEHSRVIEKIEKLKGLGELWSAASKR